MSGSPVNCPTFGSHFRVLKAGMVTDEIEEGQQVREGEEEEEEEGDHGLAGPAVVPPAALDLSGLSLTAEMAQVAKALDDDPDGGEEEAAENDEVDEDDDAVGETTPPLHVTTQSIVSSISQDRVSAASSSSSVVGGVASSVVVYLDSAGHLHRKHSAISVSSVVP